MKYLPNDQLFPPFQDFDVVHNYLQTYNTNMQARLRKRGQKGYFYGFWLYDSTYLVLFFFFLKKVIGIIPIQFVDQGSVVKWLRWKHSLVIETIWICWHKRMKPIIQFTKKEGALFTIINTSIWIFIVNLVTQGKLLTKRHILFDIYIYI